MPNNIAVIGVQWGDEGKGKIVDIMSEDFACVARYQGGHNAGHTVRIGDTRHVLHLIPSGIFHKEVTCVIGTGVVLDPQALLEEVDTLAAAGLSVSNRLFISNRCHLILPYHRVVEAAIEAQLGERRIGTTSRGIGPAYEDKAGRRGLRACDLLEPETLGDKIRFQVEQKNRTLESLHYPEVIDAEPICADYAKYAERLKPWIVDSAAYLNTLIREGKPILFEGAQATMLDVDHGTFPFVTSSSASAAGAATGLGVSPRHVHTIIGIAKAYTTRVGGGPFPTELLNGTGDTIRARGQEFGSTTGRPRRCGWFDGPAARYATMINALDALVVTKIDVLDTLEEIPFCVDYEYKGSVLREYPADIRVLEQVKPVYRTLPGWRKSTSGVREWSDLPSAAQDYLKHLSVYLEVPLEFVSTGPERDETIRM